MAAGWAWAARCSGWAQPGWPIKPGFERAGLAEELDLGLAELEGGVEDGEVFVALGDAGVLLILRGHLRALGIAGAGLKLHAEDIKLLLRELLLQGGDVGLRLQVRRCCGGGATGCRERRAGRSARRGVRGRLRRRSRGPWRRVPYRRTAA